MGKGVSIWLGVNVVDFRQPANSLRLAVPSIFFYLGAVVAALGLGPALANPIRMVVTGGAATDSKHRGRGDGGKGQGTSMVQ